MTIVQRTHVLGGLLARSHILHGDEAVCGSMRCRAIEYAERVCFVEAVGAGDAETCSGHHCRFCPVHTVIPIFSGAKHFRCVVKVIIENDEIVILFHKVA